VFGETVQPVAAQGRDGALPLLGHRSPDTSRGNPPWLPRGCPVVASRLPRGCPVVAPWLPRGCPVVAPWLPRGCPWLPRGCLAVARGCPWLPRGRPRPPGNRFRETGFEPIKEWGIPSASRGVAGEDSGENLVAGFGTLTRTPSHRENTLTAIPCG
jgi:hypothetical protein